MESDGLLRRSGDAFLADAACDGPWAEGALHGGAPAALLAHELVRGARAAGDAGADGGLRLARLTCEFLRPTPRGPLTVRREIVRPGRRLTLWDAALLDPAGTEVTRARALLLHPADLDAGEPDGPPPFPGPEDGTAAAFPIARPSFALDAMEMRFVQGAFRTPGPGTCWLRLRRPLIAGEPTLPLDRVAAAADFGNGIASVLSWEEHTFINPDLTITVERDPVDEWVALRSVMRVGHGRVAVAESELWDRRGRIGRAVQTLLVAGRAPGAT